MLKNQTKKMVSIHLRRTIIVIQFLLYSDDNSSIRIKFKENIFSIFKEKYIQNSQHNDPIPLIYGRPASRSQAPKKACFLALSLKNQLVSAARPQSPGCGDVIFFCSSVELIFPLLKFLQIKLNLLCLQPFQPLLCLQPFQPLLCLQPFQPLLCLQPFQPLLCLKL